jgi:hypothetical protein
MPHLREPAACYHIWRAIPKKKISILLQTFAHMRVRLGGGPQATFVTLVDE